MKSTPKALLAAAAFAAGAASALLAADPYVGYIYPAGIRAGTTNRFVFGGQNLQQLRDIRFSCKGLRFVSAETVPNFPNPESSQRKHLVRWLDGIAAGNPAEPELPANARTDEWRSNTWWRALNTLDAEKISIVERDLFTPKNALQATPSLRQLALVTIAADADAAPCRCTAVTVGRDGLSAPHPFLVTSAPRVAEPRYVAPARRGPGTNVVGALSGTVVLDGQVMPGETDRFRLRLAAGRRYCLAVTARELQPYVGDAVPGFFNPCLAIRDAGGRTVAFADDDARFRPDPVLDFTPSADGVYELEVHDVLYRGRADFVYQIEVGDWREARKPEADGVVSAPGATGVRRFTLDAPGPRVLEVTARRRGSPLDAVLTLKRAKDGAVLAQWDDVTNAVFCGSVPQGECDPVGTYDFREPGEYVAEIADRTGHGGPDYAWWLDIRRPDPGFEVVSSRSTLPLVRGRPLPVTFRAIRRDGFDGPIAITLPTNVVAVGGCVITSGTDAVSAKLDFVGRKGFGAVAAELFATATVDGREVRVPVRACDEYEQAFAWHHFVPADGFVMSARTPNPAKGKPRK